MLKITAIMGMLIIIFGIIHVIYPLNFISGYDCEDIALRQQRYLDSFGIKYDTYYWDKPPHVWTVVRVGKRGVALDCFLPFFDRKHYSGELVSTDKLIAWSKEDKE